MYKNNITSLAGYFVAYIYSLIVDSCLHIVMIVNVIVIVIKYLILYKQCNGLVLLL